MHNNFHKIIKAGGTGVKHNHNLTQLQMEESAIAILKGEVYPEQISAFLLGWRMKPETVEEFKGVLDGFDKFIKKTPIDNSIEMGYPYDGKVNNPYMFSLISKYIKEFDLNIIISGDKLQPAKSGITVKEISDNIKLDDNLFYFDRKDYFKELSDLTTIRERLGLRTGINSIERLLNPADSKVAILGVFHKPFVQKYIDVFSTRYEKLVIIKGNEGTPEIFGKCQYWIVQNGETQEHTINPEDFGINYKKSWERITLEESLHEINNPSDEFIKIVKLNVAMILFVCGKVDSIKDGYEELIKKY
jgi:anthranilate phosphoribosyltransferase